jgi:hypothetical protein
MPYLWEVESAVKSAATVNWDSMAIEHAKYQGAIASGQLVTIEFTSVFSYLDLLKL